MTVLFRLPLYHCWRIILEDEFVMSKYCSLNYPNFTIPYINININIEKVSPFPFIYPKNLERKTCVSGWSQNGYNENTSMHRGRFLQ